MTPTAHATANPNARAGQQSPVPAEDCLGLLRSMYLSRRLDDAEIALRKRNQVFFQISGAGHEAWNVAVGYCLRAGHDWFYPYYRDRALLVQLGMSALDMLLQATGAADDPNGHGRQMPCHFGSVPLHVVSQSSPTGSQCTQAVGCAEVTHLAERIGIGGIERSTDEITFVSLGDGTTSQGEFHESLNTACIRRLPMLFAVENNGYAISVPVEENIPGGDITAIVSGYPNLTTFDVDGTDLFACIALLSEIVPKMRRGELGPVLVQAHVTRPYSHSLSDDHAYYRTPAELAAEAERDCLLLFERRLIAEGIADADAIAAMKAAVDADVRQSMQAAIDAPKPAPDSALDHLYCNTNSPLDEEAFSAPATPEGDPIPMGQAINRCLLDEMRRDQRVVVFGQDVADATHEANLAECKGKGGVFKITYGLQRAMGKDRCFNGPLAEANIVGRAIGMATRGMRPVAEVQFFDYIWTAMMQLRDEMATMRYRSGGEWAAPAVIRVPIGGYLRGGGIYHSQTGECIFVQCPGLRVVYPSNASDAVGLLRTAIRCDDPVLFLEHKHLYYQGYNRAAYPGPEYRIPFGKAAVRRQGTDVTIVTWGALVQKSLEAAERLANEDGYQAEVIDIRTLNPLDEETILASVRKTHRLVVASEEAVMGGFGGEIAAQVAEHCFEWLDAPVRRVGSLHTWVAYSPVLEERILPQTTDVLEALRDVTRY